VSGVRLTGSPRAGAGAQQETGILFRRALASRGRPRRDPVVKRLVLRLRGDRGRRRRRDRLWLAAALSRLSPSLLAYAGHTACGLDALRGDLDRFAFLLGGDDGVTPPRARPGPNPRSSANLWPRAGRVGRKLS